jgi:hypothetical protein
MPRPEKRIGAVGAAGVRAISGLAGARFKFRDGSRIRKCNETCGGSSRAGDRKKVGQSEDHP